MAGRAGLMGGVGTAAQGRKPPEAAGRASPDACTAVSELDGDDHEDCDDGGDGDGNGAEEGREEDEVIVAASAPADEDDADCGG